MAEGLTQRTGLGTLAQGTAADQHKSVHQRQQQKNAARFCQPIAMLSSLADWNGDPLEQGVSQERSFAVYLGGLWASMRFSDLCLGPNKCDLTTKPFA